MKQSILFHGMMAILGCVVLAMGCSDPTVHSTVPRVWMVTIVVEPDKPEYDIGDQVHVDYVVLDRFGRKLEDVGATWQTPDPADVANLGGGNFEFLEGGAFTWRVTLEAPHKLSDTATLLVPSVPTRVEILVDPSLPHYAIGNQVMLDYLVYDQEDRQMQDVPASWTNPPPADVQDDGNQSFTFTREGVFTWSIALDEHPGVTDAVSLTVDASGPVITIETPERGDTIVKDGAAAEVTVSGRVDDDVAGLDVLTIRTNAMAAASVPLQADGTFSLVTPAVSGLNVVVAEAEDALGNRSWTSRAYHYASDFQAPESDGLLPGSLHVWLTEKALDRGQAPAYDPCGYDASDAYTCSEIKDLASLLELALNNLDFAEAVPGQQFNFPLLDEAWQLDLADFGEVKARIEGDFDLDFSFEHIRAGQAKVEQMTATSTGIFTDVAYGTYTDSGGETHPGLSVELGMTGILTFSVWLDLVTDDPGVQFLLCTLAANLCNPNPPNDCLGDYLESCTANPTPVLQSISTIETPLLAGLAVETMTVDASLDAELLGAPLEPEVTLADLNLSFGQGAMDASALEDLTINIGTITVGSYQIDLGTYTFPTTFLSDLVDQLLDPLLDVLQPILEQVVSELYGCEDEQNPVCYVIPFLEELLGAFAREVDVVVPDPFDLAPDAEPLATTHLVQENHSLSFAVGDGGRLDLSARIDSEKDEALDQHMDDDMLGVALSDGCLTGTGGFTGYPAGEKALQIATALDVANMSLFAVWYNGGLDLDLTASAFDLPAELDITALEAGLRMWLPPRLSGCGVGGDAVQAELGDMHVHLGLTRAGQEIDVAGFISLVVPGGFAADPSGENIRVELTGFSSFFEFEIEGMTVDGEAAGQEDLDFVEALVKDELGPQVLERLTSLGLGPMQETIPTLDISAFLGLDPGTRMLHIGDFDIHHDQEHAILNGEFVPAP